MVVDRPYHITKKSSLEFTKHFVLDISTLGLSPDFQMKFDFRAKIEKSPCRKWTDGIGSRSSYWTIIFQTQREKNHSWKSLMLSFWCFKHFAFMSAPSIYIQTFFHIERTYAFCQKQFNPMRCDAKAKYALLSFLWIIIWMIYPFYKNQSILAHYMYCQTVALRPFSNRSLKYQRMRHHPFSSLQPNCLFGK